LIGEAVAWSAFGVRLFIAAFPLSSALADVRGRENREKENGESGDE
jgi:hypothetical protein